jgi:hypothetical protein
MRIIGEIPHPDCRVTLFSWNNRYLIKLEKGLLEQTFKVNQFDVISEDDLYELVNEAFIGEALAVFDTMEATWNRVLQRHSSR